MLFTEKIRVYSEYETEPINTKCSTTGFKAAGKQSYRITSKG
jgi:hypothetical protein